MEIRLLKFRILIIVLILTNGCTSQSTLTPPLTATATKIATLSGLMPTGTTENNIPTPTLQLPPTITAISITPTLSPKPRTATLTRKEQEEKIRVLLEDEGTCALPCWWSITPGETNWDEADFVLKTMGFKVSTHGPIHQVLYDQVISSTDIIQNWINIKEEKGIVSYFDMKSIPDKGLKAFFSQWKNYSPEKIMQRYGKPSRIWLKSSQYGKNFAGYSLWLFYGKEDFLAIYGGSTEMSDTFHICPSFELSNRPMDIELIGRASFASLSLEEITEQYNSASKSYLMDFEKATNLTINDFYSLSQQEPVSFCFDTKKSIWP